MQMNRVTSKRGDVPITILVMGIVAICILTVSSFLYVLNKERIDFAGVGLIETMMSVSDEVDFHKATGFTTIYGDEFQREIYNGVLQSDFVTITNKDVLTGTYLRKERNFIQGCNGENWKIFEQCTKEIVKVTYNKP